MGGGRLAVMFREELVNRRSYADRDGQRAFAIAVTITVAIVVAIADRSESKSPRWKSWEPKQNSTNIGASTWIHGGRLGSCMRLRRGKQEKTRVKRRGGRRGQVKQVVGAEWGAQGSRKKGRKVMGGREVN